MTEHILVSFAIIVVAGTVAQWLAWKFNLPSILLLMIIGIAIGPVAGYLNPDEFFGDILFPFVSISVAIILFEGGLSLHFNEFKQISRTIWGIITIGNLVTWGLTTVISYYFLNLPLGHSLLISAILVVTGPTVIIPMLRQIKPKGRVGAILKWEGIVNDPIGAILALLVFEILIAAGPAEATTIAIYTILKSFIIGIAMGAATSAFIIYLLKKDAVPDYLQSPFILTMVIGVFALSNVLQSESGLLTVTVMGMILANQKYVTIHHIIEFKENLRVLLISFLFIVLSARLQLSDLQLLNWGSFLFVALLIIVVRPAAIFASTVKSGLKIKEKIFLSGMAPRGIVAAAITSLFAIELSEKHITGSETLVPVMFLVIIVTITLYGLTASTLAKKLDLSESNPQGCLIVGAHKLGRSIAKALNDEHFKTLLIDTNRSNVMQARMEGLNAIAGNILSESIIEEIDLDGIGKLIALTTNNEVNSLAALQFSRIFGSSNVFQIGMDRNKDGKIDEVSRELRGRILFSDSALMCTLEELIVDDSAISSTKITEEFNYEKMKEKYGEQNIIPLFLITPDHELLVYSKDNKPVPKPGDILMSIIIKNHNIHEGTP